MSKKEQQESQIISHLRKDARISLAVISQEENIPLSTTYDKVNRLQKEKVIRKFTTLVDFSKIGYLHQTKFALKVPRDQKGELLLFLQNHPAVNSLSEINGGFDFFVETIHKNIKEYTAFLESLQECFDLQEMHEYQVIEVIEHEKFLE